MTGEVFRSYLNTVFVSLKTKEYGKESKLSAQDEGLLLDVCNIVKYGESNDKSDYDIAYQNYIEPVIIHWRGTRSPNEASPYLLRQVLYYFCTSAYKDEVEEYQQTGLINKMGIVWFSLSKTGKNKGKTKPISQNVWNKWEMYPKKLYRVFFEKQPERIYPYKGGKRDEIGIGVRYLAFQAGAHSDFIDIFGGSGMASASVIHTQGTKYFYNELNRHVRNLFEVLVDDKLCKEYIRAMKGFLYDLRHITQSKSIFSNVNLDVEGYDKYDSLVKPLSASELEIKNYKDEFIISNAVIGKVGSFIKVDSERLRRNGLYFYNKNYSLSSILRMLNQNAKCSVEQLFVISEYCKNLFIPREAFRGSYKRTNAEECVGNYLSKLQTYYAFGYWLYFQVLLKTQGQIKQNEKVKYAIASTYIFSMAVQGNLDNLPSPIINYPDVLVAPSSMGGEHDTRHFINFIERFELRDSIVYSNFEQKVKKFHKAVRDVNVSGYDAIDLVKKYASYLGLRYKNKKQEDVLFYSDSPYEGTSDYEDKANGVKAFSESDMKDLIHALIDSNQKFIFSCRASATAKSNKSKDKDKKNANTEIYKNVFEEFKNTKTTPLYVTVLLKRLVKEKNAYIDQNALRQRFVDSVKNNKAPEIYITNYKVRPFYAQTNEKPRFFVDYLVLSYDDFMDIERENLKR